MAMKDLDDHARAVEHGDARGALQIAQLARADLVIDRNQREIVEISGDRWARVVVVFFFGHGLAQLDRLAPNPRLVFHALDLHARFAGTSGDRGQLSELTFTEHRGRRERAPRLGEARHHTIAERLNEALQLVEAGLEILLRNAGQTYPDQQAFRERR